MDDDECGDVIGVIEWEDGDMQPGKRLIAGDGDNAGIVAAEQGLADGRAMDFDLVMGPAFEALD